MKQIWCWHNGLWDFIDILYRAIEVFSKRCFARLWQMLLGVRRIPPPSADRFHLDKFLPCESPPGEFSSSKFPPGEFPLSECPLLGSLQLYAQELDAYRWILDIDIGYWRLDLEDCTEIQNSANIKSRLCDLV